MGDLLLHVFRKAANQIVPILPDLLRALVLRLSTALTATFSQSLILPFAYLMHSQVEVVLQLLENMEVDGKRGLDVLMTTWCDLVDTFHGFWSIRVRCVKEVDHLHTRQPTASDTRDPHSTAAFVQLLLSNRPSLNQLVVKGDLIVNPANSKGEGTADVATPARTSCQLTQGFIRANPALRAVRHRDPVEIEEEWVTGLP